MEQTIRQFLDFADRSPTAFHAVRALCDMLEQNGFSPLSEHTAWRLMPGGRYYVTRNQSALIAFTVPQTGFGPFRIAASHSDSPTFKLKPASEDASAGHYTRLNVEKYGGMIMSSWLDRPLSIAGRILVRTEEGVESRLVDLERDAVLIPNQPIHFNRDVNTGYNFNPQVDLLPLYGDESAKGLLKEQIAQAAGTDKDAIAGADLFLYSRTPGSVWGAKNEFFSCGRIDDLECAYTSLRAFLEAAPGKHINLCAVFDNEEVGSCSKQGADSTFLRDTMTRIGSALGATDEMIRAAMAGGFMASADNAHAVHPNHPGTFDAQNRTFMNGGVVIKHNANQRYTTDGVSAALFSEICKKANVPVQHFTNRSDLPGGSTLGNISNAQVSMNTVDIGLPQLAMHSCYETAGVKDLDYMIDALRAFYEAEIEMVGDGRFLLK